MPLQSPVLYAGFATIMGTHREKPVGKPYFHSSEIVKEHLDDLHKQADNPLAPTAGDGEKTMQGAVEGIKRKKRGGVVYEKQRGGEQEQELPERLMTPQQVIEILQLPSSTVWSWVTSKKLREWGRLWLAEPGGRSRPLVSLDEAESLKEKRRVGRPRKNQS